MKLTAEQQNEFWRMAQAWACSTLDTPKRAALLLEHVEGLMAGASVSAQSRVVATVASPAQGDAGYWKAPPEGILHHALRELTEREQAGAARAAADALANIDAHHARMAQRRAQSEQRTGEDRRKPKIGPVGVVEQGNRQGELRSSTDRRDASVMQPQRREFAG